ncbi:hypothetical protein TruAng_003817 [Truncatella angustata]|nr:hypothetical protein TruAng_003817 [Truncatella angustata]
MSFATILFGTQHQRADITGQGFAMHGIALKNINQALSNASSSAYDEIILAVAALAISECLVPTGPENYLTHMMGLELLIELRGPQIFSLRNSGFRKGVRFMVLFASLQLKRESIFARVEWKNAMSHGMKFEELQEQDLFDTLACCTTLIAKCDEIKKANNIGGTQFTLDRENIYTQARCLQAQLYAWRKRWDKCAETRASEVCTQKYPTRSSQGENTELHSAFNPQTDNPIVMIILYNLTLILVLQILISLAPESKLNPNTCRHLRTLDHTCELVEEKDSSEERTTALILCQNIQHYLDENKRLDASAPPIVHWALLTAWKRLRYDVSDEGQWMRELLSTKGRQVVARGLWATYKWLCQIAE